PTTPHHPTPPNTTATNSTTVTPRPVVNLIYTNSPHPPTSTLSPYTTLFRSNSGPSDAQGVSVTDTLASQLTGATYTVNGGPSNSWTGSASLGTLAAGATAAIFITATVNANTTVTSLSNTANVTSTTSDPNTA